MDSTDLPYGKPFIFKMINYNLEKSIDLDNYSLGLPRFSLGQFNTQIDLNPTISSNVYGANKFSYNRFKLDDLNEITMVHQGETYLHDLIPRINEMGLLYVDDKSPLKFLDDLGVPYLGASEITNKPLPPIGTTNQTFVMLSARPNSYVLTGQVSIKLTKS